MARAGAVISIEISRSSPGLRLSTLSGLKSIVHLSGFLVEKARFRVGAGPRVWRGNGMGLFCPAATEALRVLASVPILRSVTPLSVTLRVVEASNAPALALT